MTATKTHISPRAGQRRSCTGKNRYANAACALIACMDAKREALQDIWAYTCRFCGGYHVGHLSLEVREFARALAGN